MNTYSSILAVQRFRDRNSSSQDFQIKRRLTPPFMKPISLAPPVLQSPSSGGACGIGFYGLLVAPDPPVP